MRKTEYKQGLFFPLYINMLVVAAVFTLCFQNDRIIILLSVLWTVGQTLFLIQWLVSVKSI